MAFIKTLKDKLGNILYPVTREKCVYDDNDVRLDNKLKDITNYKSYSQLTQINSSFTMTTPIATIFSTMPDYSTIEYLTQINEVYPINGICRLVKISNNRAYAIYNMASGASLSTGLYSGSWNATNGWSGWNKILDVSMSTSSDVTNDALRFPTSQVTYQLGQEIDALNNNLAQSSELTLVNNWTEPTTSVFRKLHVIRNGNCVTLIGAARAGIITNWTTITTLPVGFRPSSPSQFRLFVMYNATTYFNLLVGHDGTVQVYDANGIVANTTEVFYIGVILNNIIYLYSILD